LNTYFNTQLIIKCAIYRPSGRPGCRNWGYSKSISFYLTNANVLICHVHYRR